MERRQFAVLAVLAGLGLGMLGNLLFYNRQIGLSFPLFIVVVVVLLLVLARAAGVALRPRSLWPLLPGTFFALMVAFRADPLMTALNVGMVLTLGALILHYLPLDQRLDESSLAQHTGALVETTFMLIPSAVIESVEAWAWLKERRQQRGQVFASVVRGGLFALPILAVFAFLLGSADAVFASYVSQTMTSISSFFGLENLDDSFFQGVLVIGIATAATGALGYGIIQRPYPPANVIPAAAEADDEAVQETVEKRKPAFKLAMLESGIIMGAVVGLFALFVFIQFAYFFGGRTTLEVAGLSYAQYARRGFFELVAVSVLTLGLSQWLEHSTVRQSQRENRIFKGLALAIVGLTSVMLVSAAQRMWLYEEAFGFTHLRVYTHVFMLWLGVLFGFFVLAVFRLKTQIFALGVVLVSIGYLATLNLMNVDHYIAERNIARYHDGQELDVRFLNILSADAIPAILPLYQQAEAGSEAHLWAGQWLRRQLMSLDGRYAGNGGTLFSANASIDGAYQQLDAVRDSLPVYDPNLYWGSFYSSYDEASDYESGWETLGTSVPGGR